MRGFLDELVARSTGLAEAIRPRPVSLFEPPVPLGVPSAAPWSGPPGDDAPVVAESSTAPAEVTRPVVPQPAAQRRPRLPAPPRPPSPAPPRAAETSGVRESSRLGLRPPVVHVTEALLPTPAPASRMANEREPRRPTPDVSRPGSMRERPTRLPGHDAALRATRPSPQADRAPRPDVPLDLIERLVARAVPPAPKDTPRGSIRPARRQAIEPDAPTAASLSSLVRQMVLQAVPRDTGAALTPAAPPPSTRRPAEERAGSPEPPPPVERRAPPSRLAPFDWPPFPVAAPPPVADAPTIRVTIGRVEIRAEASASASVAKPRPTAATMGLDDYLNGRDRGERR